MSKLKKKKKPVFHKPQTTGELRKVPMSGSMRLLSYVSLVVLVVFIVFIVYAIVKRGGDFIALSDTFALKGVALFVILGLVACMIAAGFRLAVRFIPIEMWRLPVRVKDATIKTEGKYLKIATLLIELETTLAIGYVAVTLFQDHIPGSLPLLIWVIAVAATIIFFGRYVLVKTGEG